MKCKESGIFTKKQQLIENKLRRKYGSTTMKRLTQVKCKFNHDLRVTSKRLKDKKTIRERKRINNLFNINPKETLKLWQIQSSRSLTTPKPKEVKQYYSNILCETTDYNRDAPPWLNELRNGYCKDVVTNIKDIKREHFDTFTMGLKDNNSPGLDLIIGFWNNKFYSLHSTAFDLCTKISKGILEILQWLVKARTKLISKGVSTKEPKSYRPIACENIMLIMPVDRRTLC